MPYRENEFQNPGWFDVGADLNKATTCKDCSRCCEWPGILELTADDKERLAEHLGLTDDVFQTKFMVKDSAFPELSSKPDGTCVFLENGLCSVYVARPNACRNFPKLSSITGTLMSKCALARWKIERVGTDGSVKGGDLNEEDLHKTHDQDYADYGNNGALLQRIWQR